MKNTSILETLREESSTGSNRSIDLCIEFIRDNDKNNVYYKKFNETRNNNDEILSKLDKCDKNNEKIESEFSSGKSSRDFHYGDKIYTAPITVVNHINNGSFDDSDLGISVYDRNRKRSSIESNGFSGKYIWYGVALFTLIVMTSIVATMMITMKPPQSNQILPDSDDNLFDFDKELNNWYIKRSEWTNQKLHHIERIKSPIDILYFLSTDTKNCENIEGCIEIIKKIQKDNIQKDNSNDIFYNYLISKNGLIFEGIGPNHKINFDEAQIMTFAFIGAKSEAGNISNVTRSRLKSLINYLIRIKKIKNSHEVIGDVNLLVQKPISNIFDRLRIYSVAI